MTSRASIVVFMLSTLAFSLVAAGAAARQEAQGRGFWAAEAAHRCTEPGAAGGPSNPSPLFRFFPGPLYLLERASEERFERSNTGASPRLVCAECARRAFNTAPAHVRSATGQGFVTGGAGGERREPEPADGQAGVDTGAY